MPGRGGTGFRPMPPEGLYAKYKVTKNGERVTDCFVLRPDRDSVARAALRAYADATPDRALGDDLRAWMDRLDAAQNQQPEEGDHV